MFEQKFQPTQNRLGLASASAVAKSKKVENGAGRDFCFSRLKKNYDLAAKKRGQRLFAKQSQPTAIKFRNWKKVEAALNSANVP